MIGTRNLIALTAFGGIIIFGTAACNISINSEEGSGVAETVSYDFDAFDQIDISNAFNADITIAEGTPSVEVTVDDNLVDRLDVKVDGEELSVGLNGGNVTHNVKPTVVISVSSLTELDLSGASSAIVQGVDERELKVDMSGAADADIDGDVSKLTVDGSGASSFRLAGTVDEMELELSGAGSADFVDAVVKTATVDLSGASSGDFGDLETVTGDLSGGSTIEVPTDTNASVDTSGASSVDRP